MAKQGSSQLVGLLVIGDPHLEGRQPDFRKDNYPETVLGKVEWCLDYARANKLLPTFLGDMFQNPRDNPTWMLSRLIEKMRDSGAVGIFGNHDCAETQLNDHDSLSLLVKATCLRIVDYQNPWKGEMNHRTVYIGGSSYRHPIPERFEVAEATQKQTLFDSDPLVIWLTHHDIEVPGYESGHIKPFEIENVDMLINGHIHKRSESVQVGETTWMNPGNISRRNRSDRSRDHVPRVLRIDVDETTYQVSDVVVPYEPFEKVFHLAEASVDATPTESGFVSGLKSLISVKTESGAGLLEFLDKNLDQFEDEVASEIRDLAAEITQSEPQNA